MIQTDIAPSDIPSKWIGGDPSFSQGMIYGRNCTIPSIQKEDLSATDPKQ
jgi:hypothetical protein